MQEISLSGFYESRTRQNRFGNSCVFCLKTIEPKKECMRKALGYNPYGCMQYLTGHKTCYDKKKAKLAPVPDYKKAYEVLVNFFDYIPEEEKNKVEAQPLQTEVSEPPPKKQTC